MTQTPQSELRLEARGDYYLAWLREPESLNQTICEGFDQAVADPDRQTHFFFGRYENLYIDAARIPALQTLFDAALECAGRILQRPRSGLRYGFWFNRMGPGHVTTRHTHEEDDELLSMVYYLRVPENCGDLVLYTRRGATTISPEPGMFVFFNPAMDHEVTTNHSEAQRLSLAMNIGPLVADPT